MPHWTEPLDGAFRRPPNLVPTRPADAPPVLPFDEALDLLRTQALTDFAVRRDADGYISGSTREKPTTWDDVERSLHEKLESYRKSPAGHPTLRPVAPCSTVARTPSRQEVVPD